jgi:hypothetical protein
MAQQLRSERSPFGMYSRQHSISYIFVILPCHIYGYAAPWDRSGRIPFSFIVIIALPALLLLYERSERTSSRGWNVEL